MPSSSTPLVRLCAAGGITRIELSARSGVDLKTIRPLALGREAAFDQPLSTLVRLAVALGCAPVELCPSLGMRPKTGLLYERGVYCLTREE